MILADIPRQRTGGVITVAILILVVSACDLPGTRPQGLLRKLVNPSGWINSVAWAPDSKRLAGGSAFPPVRIWDVSSGNLLLSLPPVGGSTEHVAWSPDGLYLAMGLAAPTTTLRIWNLATNREIFHASPTGGVSSLAWSPDGNTLAVGEAGIGVNGSAQESAAIVYDTVRWQMRATLARSDFVAVVAWAPDSRRLALGLISADFKQGSIVLWDSLDGHVIKTINGNVGDLQSMAWSPDGKFIAVGGTFDHTVEIWDASSYQSVATFDQGGEVKSLAWSPDSQRLASGGDDMTVKIWDVAGKRPLETLQHYGNVNSVAWSPDGKLLAAGCQNNELWIWDVK